MLVAFLILTCQLKRYMYTLIRAVRVSEAIRTKVVHVKGTTAALKSYVKDSQRVIRAFVVQFATARSSKLVLTMDCQSSNSRSKQTSSQLLSERKPMSAVPVIPPCLIGTMSVAVLATIPRSVSVLASWKPSCRLCKLTSSHVPPVPICRYTMGYL